MPAKQGEIVAANPPTGPRQGESKSTFPMPPLGKWAMWSWDLVRHFGLVKHAAVVLGFFIVALLIPLVVSWTLMLAAFLGDKTPLIGDIRNLYVATIQDGFQMLHSKIDYIQPFDLQLSADAPKVDVVSDLERGQFVEVVLQRIKVLPLKGAVNTVHAIADPPDPGNSQGCSIDDERRPGHVYPGLVNVSLSGILIRNPFKETEEPVRVLLDAEWWRMNKDAVAKVPAMLTTLSLSFEKGDIGNRTKPKGCGAVVVEGKIRIYKTRFSIPKI